MPHIKKHMISSKDKTPIYAFENLSKVRAMLSKGNWIGIIERKKDLFKIITTLGEGWIKSEDVEDTNKFDFKVYRDEAGVIQYQIKPSSLDLAY